MGNRPIHIMSGCLILMLLLSYSGSTSAANTVSPGNFAKYRLSELFNFPTIPFEQIIGQNVTETVLKQNSTGSFVEFRIQIANITTTTEDFFPNGSMIFPYIGVNTFSNPNATFNQIRSTFNLTFIQPNSTTVTKPSVTGQNINFNGSTYQGNLFSSRISMTVNVTQAFNVTQTGIPLLPLNIDLSVLTFPSDLVYNLTATSSISIPFYASGTGKFQMILLSSNLSLGDPVLPLPWYAALIVIPLGLLGYVIYRRRRAAKRLAQQSRQGKPDYWVQ